MALISLRIKSDKKNVWTKMEKSQNVGRKSAFTPFF